MPLYSSYIKQSFRKVSKKNLLFIIIFFSCLGCLCFKCFYNNKSSITNLVSTPPSIKPKRLSHSFFSLPNHNEYELIEKLSLKEQIEEDLKIFDFIDNVRVGFSKNQEQIFSKLSLIISPNVKFNEQAHIKLKSVLEYLCSTINNLSPENISISDTEGNLYSSDAILNLHCLDLQNILIKKELTMEIDNYIQKILPKKHYFFLLNLCDSTTKEANIDVNINNEYFNLLSKNQQEKLFSDLSILIRRLAYNKNMQAQTTFHCFQFVSDSQKSSSKQQIMIAVIYFSASCLILGAAYLYLLSQNFRKNRSLNPTKPKDHTQLKSLINFMKTESPHKIAHMLRYLDKEKAKYILESLEERSQEEIKKLLKENK